MLKGNEAKENGIVIKDLDAQYPSAFQKDSTKAVFKENRSEYEKELTELIKGLTPYLTKNNFYWETEFKIFSNLYFNDKSELEVFLFNIQSGILTEKQLLRLEYLLKQYFEKYKMKIQTTSKFKQCGTWIMRPNKSKNSL